MTRDLGLHDVVAQYPEADKELQQLYDEIAQLRAALPPPAADEG